MRSNAKSRADENPGNALSAEQLQAMATAALQRETNALTRHLARFLEDVLFTEFRIGAK